LLSKVKSLALLDQTTKNELLKILKEDARTFNLQDIARCSLKIQQEADCIHTSYKKEYIKAETGFIILTGRLKMITSIINVPSMWGTKYCH
jgi:uncharacterized protein (UPF0305 family)